MLLLLLGNHMSAVGDVTKTLAEKGAFVGDYGETPEIGDLTHLHERVIRWDKPRSLDARIWERIEDDYLQTLRDLDKEHELFVINDPRACFLAEQILDLVGRKMKTRIAYVESDVAKITGRLAAIHPSLNNHSEIATATETAMLDFVRNTRRKVVKIDPEDLTELFELVELEEVVESKDDDTE